MARVHAHWHSCHSKVPKQPPVNNNKLSGGNKNDLETWIHMHMCNMLGRHRSKLVQSHVDEWHASCLIKCHGCFPSSSNGLCCSSHLLLQLLQSLSRHFAPQVVHILLLTQSWFWSRKIHYQGIGYSQTWMHLWKKRVRDGSHVSTHMVLLHLQVSLILYVTPQRTSWELDASLQAYLLA